MGVPLLPSDPPPLVSDFGAQDLMNTKVVSFSTIVSVQYVLEVLTKVKHQGFPVVIESAEAEVSSHSYLDYAHLWSASVKSLITIVNFGIMDDKKNRLRGFFIMGVARWAEGAGASLVVRFFPKNGNFLKKLGLSRQKIGFSP